MYLTVSSLPHCLRHVSSETAVAPEVEEGQSALHWEETNEYFICGRSYAVIGRNGAMNGLRKYSRVLTHNLLGFGIDGQRPGKGDTSK